MEITNQLIEKYSEAWEEYVDNLADSWKHKAFLRSSDDCFFEWIEEQEETNEGGK